MDFGFIINVRNKVLSIGNKEILLLLHNLSDKIKLIMKDDSRIPPNTQKLLATSMQV